MVSYKETWPPTPLHSVIVEILVKHNGVMLDKDLLQNITRIYGEVPESKLNNELMKLEIEGIIHVSYITKSRRKIEIIKPGQGYMGVGED